MELDFLAVDQGLYSLEVIAGRRRYAKHEVGMRGHDDRHSGCRKVLPVVVQNSVEDIESDVYLAVCLRLSGSLLGGGLIGSGLLGSGLLGSGLLGSSLLSSNEVPPPCGRSDFSLGGSLGFIASLNPASSLVLRHSQFFGLGLVHLLHAILSRFRRDGLSQGTGSTRGPHGKDQQCRHRGRNDPLSQGHPRAVLQGFAYVSFLHLSTSTIPRKRPHA